jgi:hypothetical protein
VQPVPKTGNISATVTFVKLALIVSALAFASANASAHSRSGPPEPGIPIPSLTHGQMAVMARYRRETVDLASRQTKTDPTFRRLLNYGNIQYTYCLWGLVPGSIRDEESPFNECSHAYLAATKAVLAYMQGMPSARDAANDLVSRIDADMVRTGASWVLCQYSGEPFSTGGIVVPRWRDVPFHAPSLVAFLTALCVPIAGLVTVFRRRAAPSGPSG